MNKNKNIYGIKLYIPFEDLSAYIHECVDVKKIYKNHTFIPIKVEVNEIDFGIDIQMISVVPNEIEDRRYKLDLNKLHTKKENN